MKGYSDLRVLRIDSVLGGRGTRDKSSCLSQDDTARAAASLAVAQCLQNAEATGHHRMGKDMVAQ